MSKLEKAAEPSMDDILSSIRKIIAEEPVGSSTELEAATAMPTPVEPKLEMPAPVLETPAPIADTQAPAPETPAPVLETPVPAADLSPFDAFIAASTGQEPQPAPEPAPPAAPAAAESESAGNDAPQPAAAPVIPTPVLQPIPEPASQPAPAPVPAPAAEAKPDTLSDDLMALIGDVPQTKSPLKPATAQRLTPASASNGVGGPAAIPATVIARPESAASDGPDLNEQGGPSAFAPAKPANGLAQSVRAAEPQDIAGDVSLEIGTAGEATIQADEAAPEAPAEPAPVTAKAPESAAIPMPAPEPAPEAAAAAAEEPAPEVAEPERPAPVDVPAAEDPSEQADAAPAVEEPAAAAAPAPQAPAAPAPVDPPAPEPEVVAAPVPAVEKISEPDDAPAAEPAPAVVAGAGAGALVSATENAGTVVRTLEDTVAELLRPMLRDWLDANMPRIVEKTLKIELARSVATDLEGKDPD